MEALEVEQWIEIARAGRVTVENGGKVGAENGTEARVPVKRALECLRYQSGVDIRVIEPLGEPVADGFFERLVAEDRREDEAAERRLRLHRLLGFRPHLDPDRIDDLNDGCCRIGFRHVVPILRRCETPL
jgi:hypothetical protein